MNSPVSADLVRIRKHLRHAEAAADTALLAQTELMSTILRARATGNYEVHTAQAALIRLAKAQQSVMDSSTDLFRVHNELNKVAVEVGIGDHDGSTKPYPDGITAGHSAAA